MRCAVNQATRLSSGRAFLHSLLWVTLLFSTGPSSAQDKPAVPPIAAPKANDHEKRAPAPVVGKDGTELPELPKGETRFSAERMRRFTGQYCYLPTEVEPRGLGLTPTPEEKKNLDCADQILENAYFTNAAGRNALINLPKKDNCSLKRVLSLPDDFRVVPETEKNPAAIQAKIDALVAEGKKRLEKFPREQDSLALCYFFSQHRNPYDEEKNSNEYKFELAMERAVADLRLNRLSEINSMGILPLHVSFKDKAAPKSLSCAEGSRSNVFEAYFYRENYLDEKWSEQNERWRKANPKLAAMQNWFYERKTYMRGMRLRLCDLYEDEKTKGDGGQLFKRLSSAIKHFSQPNGTMPLWITDALLNLADAKKESNNRDRLLQFLVEGYVTQDERKEDIRGAIDGCPAVKEALTASLKKDFESVLLKIGPRPISDEIEKFERSERWVGRHQDPIAPLDMSDAAQEKRKIQQKEEEKAGNARRTQLEEFVQKALVSSNIAASVLIRGYVECNGPDDAHAKAFFDKFIPKLSEAPMDKLQELINQLSAGTTPESHELNLSTLALRPRATAPAVGKIGAPPAPYCLFSLDNEPRYFTAASSEAVEKIRGQLKAIEPILFPTPAAPRKTGPNAVERSFLWSVNGQIGEPEAVTLSPLEQKGILGFLFRSTATTAGIGWDRLFENTVVAEAARKAFFPPDKNGEYETNVEARIVKSPFPAVAAAIVREHLLKKLEAAQADRAVGEARVLADAERQSFGKLRSELCVALRAKNNDAIQTFAQLRKFVAAVRSADPLNAKQDLTEERLRLFLSLEPPLRDKVNDIIHASCSLKYPDFKARLFQELVGGAVAPYSSFEAKGAWITNLERYDRLCAIVTEMEKRVPANAADKQAFDAQFRNDGPTVTLLQGMSLPDLERLLYEIKATPAHFGKLVISGKIIRVNAWEEESQRPQLTLVPPAATTLMVKSLPTDSPSSVYVDQASKHLVSVYEQADKVLADTKTPPAQIVNQLDGMLGDTWAAAYGSPFVDRNASAEVQQLKLRSQADDIRFFLAMRRFGLLGVGKGGNPLAAPSKDLTEQKEFARDLLLVRERGRELLAATSALREELAKLNEDSTHGAVNHTDPRLLLRGIIKEQDRWRPLIEKLKGEVAAGRLKAAVLREAMDVFQGASAEIEKMLSKHISAQKPLPNPLSYEAFSSVNLQFPRNRDGIKMGFQLINIPLSTISKHGKLSDAVFDHMNQQKSCGADKIFKYSSPEDALYYFQQDINYLYRDNERDEKKRERLPAWICWAATICAPLVGNKEVKRTEQCRLGGPAVQAIRDYIDKEADVLTRISAQANAEEIQLQQKASGLIRRFVDYKLGGSYRNNIIAELEALKKSDKPEDRRVFSMVASVVLQLPSTMGSDIFLHRLMAPSRFIYAIEGREAEMKAEEEARYRTTWSLDRDRPLFRDNDPARMLLDPFSLDGRGFGALQNPRDPRDIFLGRTRLSLRGGNEPASPLLHIEGLNPRPDLRPAAPVRPRIKLLTTPEGGFEVEGGGGFTPLKPGELTELLGRFAPPADLGPQPEGKVQLLRPRFVLPEDMPTEGIKPGDANALLPVILRGPDGKLVTLPRRKPNGLPLRLNTADEIDPTFLVPLDVGPADPGDNFRLGRSGFRWDPKTLAFDEVRRELPLTHEELKEFRELLKQAPNTWLQHQWARELANVPTNKTLRQELTELREAVMVARTAVDNTPVPNIPETTPKTPALAELEKEHVAFLSKIVNELYDYRRGGTFDFAKVNAMVLPFAELEEKFKRAEVLGGEWLVLQEVRNLIEDQRAYLRIAIRSNRRAPICFHRMFSTLSAAPARNDGYTCIDSNAMTPELMKSAEELEKVLAIISGQIRTQISRGEVALGRSSAQFTDFVRIMVGPEQELAAREQRILAGGDLADSVVVYGNNWGKPKARQTLSTIPRHDVIDYNSMWKSNLDFARMPAWTKYEFVRPNDRHIPDHYMLGRLDVTSVQPGDRLYYDSNAGYGPWASRLNQELSRVDVSKALREALIKKGEFMHMLKVRRDGENKWYDENKAVVRRVFDEQWGTLPSFRGLAPDTAAAWHSYPPYMRELMMRALDRPKREEMSERLDDCLPHTTSGSGLCFRMPLAAEDVLVMDPTDLQAWVSEPWPGKILGLARQRHSQGRYGVPSTGVPPLLPTACDRFLAMPEVRTSPYKDVVALLDANKEVLCGRVDDAAKREKARDAAIRLLHKVYGENELLKTASFITAAEWAQVPQSDKVKALRLALAQQTKQERDYFAGKMFSELKPDEVAKQLLSFIIQTADDWGNELTGTKAEALELAKGGPDRYTPIHNAVLGMLEVSELARNKETAADLAKFVERAAEVDKEIDKENRAYDDKENTRLEKERKELPGGKSDGRAAQRVWDRSRNLESSWTSPRHPDGHTPRLGAGLSSAQRLAMLAQDKRSRELLAGVWDHIEKNSPSPEDRPRRVRNLVTGMQYSPQQTGLHWAGQFDPDGTVLRKLAEAQIAAHDKKVRDLERDLLAGKSPTAEQLGFITKEVSDRWKQELMSSRLKYAQLMAAEGIEVPVQMVSDKDLLADPAVLPHLIEEYLNARKMVASKREFDSMVSRWLAAEPPPRSEKVQDIAKTLQNFGRAALKKTVEEFPEWMVTAGGFKDADEGYDWFAKLHGLMLPQARSEREGMVGSLDLKEGTDRETVIRHLDKWLLTQALTSHGGSDNVTVPQSRPAPVDPKDPTRQVAAAPPAPLPNPMTQIAECHESIVAAMRELPPDWEASVAKGKLAEREVFEKREPFRAIARDVRVVKQKLAFISKQVRSTAQLLEDAQKLAKEGNDKAPGWMPPASIEKLDLKLKSLRKLKEVTTISLNTLERKAEAILEALQTEMASKKPAANQTMIDPVKYYSHTMTITMDNCMERYAAARLEHAKARGLPPFEEQKFREQERAYFNHLLDAREAMRAYLMGELLAGRAISGIPESLKSRYSDLTGNRFPGDTDQLTAIWNELLPRLKAIHARAGEAFTELSKYGLTEAALRRTPPDFSGFKVPAGSPVLTMHDLRKWLALATRQFNAEKVGFFIAENEWEKHPLANALFDAFKAHVAMVWTQASSPNSFALNKDVAAHVIPSDPRNGGEFYMQFQNLQDVKNQAKELIKDAKLITENSEWFLDLRASQNHTVDLLVWALSKTNPVGWVLGQSLEDTDVTGHKADAQANVDNRIKRLIEARNELYRLDGISLDMDGSTMSGLAIATHFDVEKETGVRDQLTQTLADSESDRYWQMAVGAAYVAAIGVAIATAGTTTPFLAALGAAAHGAITAGTLHYISDISHDVGYVTGRLNGDIDEKSGGVKQNWAYNPNHFYSEVGPEALTSMGLFAAGSFGASYVIGMAQRALMVSKAAAAAGTTVSEAQAAARTLRAMQAAGQSAKAIEASQEYLIVSRMALAAGEKVTVQEMMGGLLASDVWASSVAQGAMTYQTATNAVTMYGTNVAGRTGITYLRNEYNGVPQHLQESFVTNLVSELSTIAFMSGGDRLLASKVGPKLLPIFGTKRVLDLTLPAKTAFAGGINVGISQVGKVVTTYGVEEPQLQQRFQAIVDLMNSGDPDQQARGYTEMSKFSEAMAKRKEEKKLEIYKEVFHALTIDIGMFGRKAALQSYRETAASRAAKRIELGQSPTEAIERMRSEMKGGWLSAVASPLESSLHYVSKKPGEAGPKPHEFRNLIDVNGGAEVLVALRKSAKEKGGEKARELYEGELKLLQERMKKAGLQTETAALERMLDEYIKNRDYKDAPLLSEASKLVVRDGELVDLGFEGGILPFHEFTRRELAKAETTKHAATRAAIKTPGPELQDAIRLEQAAWKVRLDVDPKSWEKVPAVLLAQENKQEVAEEMARAYARSKASASSELVLANMMFRYLAYAAEAKGNAFGPKVTGKQLAADFEAALRNPASAMRWMNANKVSLADYRAIFGESELVAAVTSNVVLASPAARAGALRVSNQRDFQAFMKDAWMNKAESRAFTETQWLEAYRTYLAEKAK